MNQESFCFTDFLKLLLTKINNYSIPLIERTNVLSIFDYMEEFMTEFKNDKYFVRKTIVYYDEPSCIEKGLLDTFEPVTTQSTNYENWRAILDLKTCIDCRSKHGQIYRID